MLIWYSCCIRNQDFCNKIKSSYICLQLHLEPSSECISRDDLIEFPMTARGPCTALTEEVHVLISAALFALLLSYLRWAHTFCVAARAATDWLRCGMGVPHRTRYLLPSMFKAIPGQASALFTAQGSVLCLGLWKFQMCQYFMNFLISDTNESFVLFLQLLHKVFPLLCCYNFSSNERTTWKYQQFIVYCSCWMYQIVCSPCVCQQVFCGATFPFPVWRWGEVLWGGVCMGTTSLCDQLCPCTLIAK